MAALMPQGKQQYFTAGGIPLVGGKVYTYAAGTTTPLATYTTAAASTPNTNPVILDSRGEASIFFSAANYKVVLKDSLDSTIWTQDNLPGDQAATILANLAASTGASLVNYLDRTVEDRLKERISVRDYTHLALDVGGATEDWQPAFQAAILALPDASGGTVYIPAGEYKVRAPIQINRFGVTLKGENKNSSRILCGYAALTCMVAITFSGAASTALACEIDNIYFGNGTGAGWPKYAILVDEDKIFIDSRITNCWCGGFGAPSGADIGGFFKGAAASSIFVNNVLDTYTGVGFNLRNAWQCVFNNNRHHDTSGPCYQIGYAYDGSPSVGINTNNQISNAEVYNYNIDSFIKAHNCRGLQIANVSVESKQDSVWVSNYITYGINIADSSGVTVNNVHIQGTKVGANWKFPRAVYLANVSGVFSNITTDTCQYLLWLDSDAYNLCQVILDGAIVKNGALGVWAYNNAAGYVKLSNIIAKELSGKFVYAPGAANSFDFSMTDCTITDPQYYAASPDSIVELKTTGLQIIKDNLFNKTNANTNISYWLSLTGNTETTAEISDNQFVGLAATSGNLYTLTKYNVGAGKEALTYYVPGPITASVPVLFQFALPYDCKILSMSVIASTVDSANADENYAFDLSNGSSMLTGAALVVNAATVVTAGANGSNYWLTQNTIAKIVLSIWGTTPSISGVSVIVNYVRMGL